MVCGVTRDVTCAFLTRNKVHPAQIEDLRAWGIYYIVADSSVVTVNNSLCAASGWPREVALQAPKHA